MNNTQNPVGPENSQLAPTRNPQTPGGQALSGTGGSGLQTPSNVVDDSENLSITSVGTSNTIQPISIENSTQISGTTQPPAKTPPYGVIAISSLAIILVFFVTWLMTRKKPD